MNITIISGGSGSDSLIKGLIGVGGNQVKITNLINLYDDGKSTGVCRYVMDVLGPSDLRKVQYSQWQADGNTTQSISNLYELRPDLTISNFEDICNMFIDILPRRKETAIFKACIKIFKEYILRAYDNNEEINENLKSFNIANILYSTLFKTHGITETIDIFKSFLDIQHDVVINSYTKSILTAKCKNGYICNYESDIVDLNGKDMIESIDIDPTPITSKAACDCIRDCDILIISSGTPYSSILPTLNTPYLKWQIRNSKALKIIIANNAYDTDSIGVDLDGVLKLYSKRINLKTFEIIINHDADKTHLNTSLKLKNIHKKSFGKTKHQRYKLGIAIFSIYFKTNASKKRKYVFDFDDTLWSRHNEKLSMNNLSLIRELSNDYNIEIASGNSYEHIKNCDRNGVLFNIPIWADGTNLKYKYNKIKESYTNCVFTDEFKRKIINYALDNNLFFEVRNDKVITIKCTQSRRIFHYSKIKKLARNKEVRLNGRTSIEIFIDNPDKYMIYNIYDSIFFIGDSPVGNDKMMFKKANKSIISNVKKTNIFLTYLLKINTLRTK